MLNPQIVNWHMKAFLGEGLYSIACSIINDLLHKLPVSASAKQKISSLPVPWFLIDTKLSQKQVCLISIRYSQDVKPKDLTPLHAILCPMIFQTDDNVSFFDGLQSKKKGSNFTKKELYISTWRVARKSSIYVLQDRVSDHLGIAREIGKNEESSLGRMLGYTIQLPHSLLVWLVTNRIWRLERQLGAEMYM